MKNQFSCYCGAAMAFSNCCAPIIAGHYKATTAEVLMRSRYSAYASHSVDYLMSTLHVSQRKYYTQEAIYDWASSNEWQRLEILKSTPTTVEFKTYFSDSHHKAQIHHEKATFVYENLNWFYVEGLFGSAIY